MGSAFEVFGIEIRNGQNYYYHADALGSIYQMTDSAQNVVKEYDYSAFGKIISESGSLPFENPITYTGREFDSDSGLYFYRARYYDAEAGRFLSRDPIVSNPLGPFAVNDSNPFSQNANLNDAIFLKNVGSEHLYKFTFNNPVIHSDPTGMGVTCEILCTIGTTLVCLGFGWVCGTFCAPTVVGTVVCTVKCGLECAIFIQWWGCKKVCPPECP